MMFIKPSQALAVQELIAEEYEREGEVNRELKKLMNACPVCDDDTCGKDIVRANGVYVHPEDVAEADKIERPTFE